MLTPSPGLRLALSFLGAVSMALSVRAESELANWSAPPYWKPPAKVASDSVERTESIDQVASLGPPALPFFALTPCRVADTRGNGFSGAFGPPSLSAGIARDFPITGSCFVPPGAAAVSANITVTTTTGPGDIRVYPQGTPEPLVSTLDYTLSQTVANAAIVPLGASGAISVIADVHGANLIIDVNGYYAASGVVTNVNGMTGGISLLPGTDLTVTPGSHTLTISANSDVFPSPNTLVRRDASGTLSGSLNGNAASATVAASAASADSVGGSTAAQVHSAELLANAATSANTPSTIVLRDGSGNVQVGKIAASGYTQSGTGGETLRIVRGTFAGANGAIVNGSGFGVVRNGAGDYTVTYSTGFSATPTVTVTHVSLVGGYDFLTGLTSNAFRVLTLTPAGVGIDQADVGFIAVGNP